MKKLLSICIPTYNGGESLIYNIEYLIKLSLKYNLEICVSDNASTDDTETYMKYISKRYNFIKYHRNSENKGIAYNFDNALRMSTSKYCWLLGDDDIIIEENIEDLLDLLKNERYNFIVVNARNRNYEHFKLENIPTNVYKDKNLVLSDLGRYMSWMSSLIYFRSLVDIINVRDIKNNAFPHLIAILKYLDYKCNLYWFDKELVTKQNIQQMRYSNNVLNYFIKDWYYIPILAGDYKEKSKELFYRKIGDIFSIKAIMGYRRKNILTIKSLIKLKNELIHFPIAIGCKLILISLFPTNLLKFIYYIYKGRKNEK